MTYLHLCVSFGLEIKNLVVSSVHQTQNECASPYVETYQLNCQLPHNCHARYMYGKYVSLVQRYASSKQDFE